MEEGERKRAEAQARLEAARSVLPRAKLAELEQQNKHLEKEWNMLVGQMDQTQYVHCPAVLASGLSGDWWGGGGGRNLVCGLVAEMVPRDQHAQTDILLYVNADRHTCTHHHHHLHCAT